jgi:pre-mRNA-splicing factor ISY1
LKQQNRKRGDILKHITPAYFGWRDEEDGVLLELEAQAQKKRRREGDPGGRRSDTGDLSMDDNLATTGCEYLDVPSQEEVAKILLEEKKKALLAKFAI